jgi:hypothetical protein
MLTFLPAFFFTFLLRTISLVDWLEVIWGKRRGGGSLDTVEREVDD